MSNDLWEFKYRPTAIDDYVFQDERQKKLILKFIADKSIPSLLLDGHRGTGKTSLAYVLKHELGIDDSDFMKINASDDNNVDIIREKVKGFISTYATGPFKVVFLDEADYLSHSAQAALRGLIEEYIDNARFILTCNKGNKIMPELRSRCTELLFKRMSKENMFERLCNIIVDEDIQTDTATINKYIELAYPDIRKVIKLMQFNVTDGVLEQPPEITDNEMTYVEITMAMERGNIQEIRELLANILDDDWDALYSFLYTNLHEIGKFVDDKKWKSGVVIIADHLYRHSNVADPEINAVAMFIRLGEV